MESHYIDELAKKHAEEREAILKEGYTINIYDGETGELIGTEQRSALDEIRKKAESGYYAEKAKEHQAEREQQYGTYDGETGRRINSEQPVEEPTAPTWEPADYAWAVVLALAVVVLICSIAKLSRQFKH